jgi:hypothetical protein
MDEMKHRRRRALQRAVVRAVMIVAVGALASPFRVSAQATASSTAPERTRHPGILFVPQAHYGALTRIAAGGAVLIATRQWKCEDGWCYAPGLELNAMTGTGGWRVGGGFSSIGVIWSDALVTVTRTRPGPRGASPESTYVGVEGGLTFPIYGVGNTALSVRPGIGVARRVQGARPDRTTFTWNVGASLILPNP